MSLTIFWVNKLIVILIWFQDHYIVKRKKSGSATFQLWIQEILLSILIKVFSRKKAQTYCNSNVVLHLMIFIWQLGTITREFSSCLSFLFMEESLVFQGLDAVYLMGCKLTRKKQHKSSICIFRLCIDKSSLKIKQNCNSEAYLGNIVWVWQAVVSC